MRWHFKGKHKKLFPKADKMLLKILCSAEHFKSEEQQSWAKPLNGKRLSCEGILSTLPHPLSEKPEELLRQRKSNRYTVSTSNLNNILFPTHSSYYATMNTDFKL